jgi:hypothetical protein
MAQSDFTSLAVRYELADEDMHSKRTEVKIISDCKHSALMTFEEVEDKGSKEVYTPFNIIPDELSAFLAACESSTVVIKSLSNCMDFKAAPVPVSQDIFEPTRFLNDFAPPKLFYRTFWRSAARRILKLSKDRTK